MQNGAPQARSALRQRDKLELFGIAKNLSLSLSQEWLRGGRESVRDGDGGLSLDGRRADHSTSVACLPPEADGRPLAGASKRENVSNSYWVESEGSPTREPQPSLF